MKYIIIGISMLLIICIYVVFTLCSSKSKKKSPNLANDVTELNETLVSRIFYIQSVNDIQDTIQLAVKNKKHIIARGQSHTMGGHTLTKEGYILDMKFFDRILHFDQKNMLLRVQPGATWSHIIKFLNDYGYSPEILQSYCSFSVGGTISVNAHGITSDYPLIYSVHEMKVILSDPQFDYTPIVCGPKTNKELFSLVIGGFGLFGIITEVTLKVNLNQSLKIETYKLNVNSFPIIYEKILNDPSVKVKIARINIINMNDITLYLFKTTHHKRVISYLPAKPKEMSKVSKLLYKWIIPTQTFKMFRHTYEYLTEKPIDMHDVQGEEIDKNDLLYESAEPLTKLYNPLVDVEETHILQEYFIPNQKYKAWMKYLKEVFCPEMSNGVRLLNVTIRYVYEDHLSYLPYAQENYYAFVFYYRCKKSEKCDLELKAIHHKLVNKTISLNGTFYLPYRHHYSFKQL